LKESVKRITNSNKTIEIVPNVLSPHFNYDNDKEKDDRFTIISVGGLIKRKRHDLLIKAFAKTFGSDTKVKLDIIGDGEEKENLLNLIKSLKMENNIYLLGRLSREETALKMKRSHVFALPSKNETFGVVYI